MKQKKKKYYYNGRLLFFIFLLLVICAIIVLFNIFPSILEKDTPKQDKQEFPSVCNIPSYEEVWAFCQEKDYQSGYVSMTCGKNEVYCYKKLDSITSQGQCIKWN